MKLCDLIISCDQYRALPLKNKLKNYQEIFYWITY